MVLEDTRWSIAFTAPLAWVPALVAGCVAEPPTVEDFLVAADFYRRGLAADVTDRFLEADRIRLGRRAPAGQPQAVAERRADAASIPAPPTEEGQLYVSLPKRYLSAQGRAAALVHQRGELEVFERDRGTGKYVTYQLPSRWTVHIAREAPW